MSIAARYDNGVFKPLGEVRNAATGEVYRVFSEEELRDLKDELAWLKAAESSFEFWDNEEDSVYDGL
jgi:predicted DNA-binding antitoxin AbrB/MazE fold protein